MFQPKGTSALDDAIRAHNRFAAYAQRLAEVLPTDLTPDARARAILLTVMQLNNARLAVKDADRRRGPHTGYYLNNWWNHPLDTISESIDAHIAKFAPYLAATELKLYNIPAPAKAKRARKTNKAAA